MYHLRFLSLEKRIADSLNFILCHTVFSPSISLSVCLSVTCKPWKEFHEIFVRCLPNWVDVQNLCFNQDCIYNLYKILTGHLLLLFSGVGALIEPSNLMKMRNTIFGQSAPSLTGGPFISSVSHFSGQQVCLLWISQNYAVLVNSEFLPMKKFWWLSEYNQQTELFTKGR